MVGPILAIWLVLGLIFSCIYADVHTEDKPEKCAAVIVFWPIFGVTLLGIVIAYTFVGGWAVFKDIWKSAK